MNTAPDSSHLVAAGSCSVLSLLVVEEEFHVKTCCVAVDFSIGRETYSFIQNSLKDKEIGILGKYIIIIMIYKKFRISNIPEMHKS